MILLQGMGWTLLGPALVNLEMYYKQGTANMVFVFTAHGFGYLGLYILVQLIAFIYY